MAADKACLCFGCRLMQGQVATECSHSQAVCPSNTDDWTDYLCKTTCKDIGILNTDRQGSNFEFCAWRTVSSHSFHHSQEVILAQFSLYVHKGGIKPDLFHFFAGYVTCRTRRVGYIGSSASK